MTFDDRQRVEAALNALGVRRLVLAVFDQSFPAVSGEDLGRGSPYGTGAAQFLEFASALGFNGIQLGPQGLTTVDNPSPYDATLFSRNPLSIAARPLVEGGLLDERALQSAAAATPADAALRVDYSHAWRAVRATLDQAWETHRLSPDSRAASLAEFGRRHRTWLVPDGLYDLLCARHGGRWHEQWGDSAEGQSDQCLFDPPPGQGPRAAARLSELAGQHAEALERYAFEQWLVHEQHEVLRRTASSLQLALYGDLQIGVSTRDAWAHRALFLRDYLMGAPPSRTNPEGQPWNYPVLDPGQYVGSVGALVRARARKLFAEFDGLRIDHPHGLVDPWVYRAGQADPLWAVQHGARLFSSPDLPDHPELAVWAIARPEQLNRAAARHADEWVRDLDPSQVDCYARLFHALADAATESGRSAHGLICEVLSTQPFQLRKVLERHGLGRFRVTQKANLDDPADVYRCENAAPADWVMLGNHDTLPIWSVVQRWAREGGLARQAEYLAARLAPEPGARAELTRRLITDSGLMVQAHLANLFACPAQNVQIFFGDLLGLEEPFNRPGTISDANWSLRVPPDYAQRYAAARARNAALHLPRALAMALRARAPAGYHRALLDALERGS